MRRGRTITCCVLAASATCAPASVAVAVPLSFDSGVVVTETAVRSAVQTQHIARPAPDTARYRVTLSIDWTSTTHPVTLPPNAHVSPPVVATHSAPGAMFRPGTLSSPGIESMAETGGTSVLRAELGANPAVSAVDVAAGVFGTATRTFTLDLDQRSDLISMVTMIAPSPDWFAGFADSDMFVDGAWVESVAFPLGNYDAGTDSGSDFRSPDADTQPQGVIGVPSDAAFVAATGENPFGAVRIERVG